LHRALKRRTSLKVPDEYNHEAAKGSMASIMYGTGARLSLRSDRPRPSGQRVVSVNAGSGRLSAL